MIGSYLCHFIAQGKMFGPDQKVQLQMIELPMAEEALNGLCMELDDCAYDLVDEITQCYELDKGFEQIDLAVLVGAMPRGPGMERKDLLEKNAKIFEEQGKALDKYAKKNVKVLVIGNPCNTNALITSHHAPSIPKKNITALTRLDQSRAQGQIAKKTCVKTSDIKNIIIWGNHSATQYPDVNHANIGGKNVREVVQDDEYLNEEFITKVAKRGAEIIQQTGKSSAASAAVAACDHVKSWW